MPRPVAFTKTLFWLIWSKWLGDPSLPSALDYPPRKKRPIASVFFQPSIFAMPRPVAFTGTLFWLIWSQ